MRGGGVARLHHRIRASEGMVTAEFALAILAAVPLMISLVMLSAAAAGHVQVMEAARTAARMLARGDSEQRATEQVMSAVPQARVMVVRDDAEVVVTVTRPMAAFGLLPRFAVTGTARTPVEASESEEWE